MRSARGSRYAVSESPDLAGERGDNFIKSMFLDIAWGVTVHCALYDIIVLVSHSAHQVHLSKLYL
jgi:hypothetical protein